jgi:phospholipid-binding lipoprotein MlaA
MFQKSLLIVAVALSLSGCAGTGPESPDNDPFERANRFMFRVNVELDNYIIKPVSKGYLYVPSPVRRSVRNFLDNLASPVTLANDLLQLEGKRASTTALRLGINSTVGIFGLFDPAKRLGLEKHGEDFGQTMATWGVPEGPYLFTPIYGPSSPREFGGWIVGWGFDPMTYQDNWGLENAIGRYAIDGIDARAENISVLDEIERSSVDFYATVRSLYQQNRASEIVNGVTDIDDLPDIDALDDLDDF